MLIANTLSRAPGEPDISVDTVMDEKITIYMNLLKSNLSVSENKLHVIRQATV